MSRFKECMLLSTIVFCFVHVWLNLSISTNVFAPFQSRKPHNITTEVKRMQNVFNKCSPKQTIVFLKTHKTGSTTLARIIELYGYRNSLAFVRKIGERGSIHYGNRRFSKTSHHTFLPPPNVTRGNYTNYKYNIFTLHVRYDRKIIDGFMKEDPIYITLLREPSKQFESAFVFFNKGKLVKLPRKDRRNRTLINNKKITRFLVNPKKYPKLVSSRYINNDQIFDLGLNTQYVLNDKVINETIAKINKDMDIVLINEYYDESLVLLSKILCWSLEDLVYLPRNERPDSQKVAMSKNLRQKAREWNHADTMLYNFFVERLKERFIEYGPSFEEDLRRFRNMTAELRRSCVGGQVVKGPRKAYTPTANNSGVCQFHTEDPSKMDERIRKRMGARIHSSVNHGIQKTQTKKKIPKNVRRKKVIKKK
ncbi:galactosylceramide sulfotransferase-like [Anneissia japonica]|uniref:galactosylceramide sulfotransferase-like n=1 Tax=Anneissia japonica TaxID=1529436 RepID=UPI001425B501|nr:galactosylceramide sulfotransferase-like [Anneissia japonica]XP_033107791.1 galactosylceramide sulfotransferase-like [Anneissia japonica]